MRRREGSPAARNISTVSPAFSPIRHITVCLCLYVKPPIVGRPTTADDERVQRLTVGPGGQIRAIGERYGSQQGYWAYYLRVAA